MRAGYAVGDILIAAQHGRTIVHAGGRPVLIDVSSLRFDSESVTELSLTDKGNSLSF